MNSLSLAEPIILTIEPPPCNAAHMPQRSPLILWLLVAATLSLDAVLISWVAIEPYPAPVHAVIAFHAMILSQLSVVCTWSVLRMPAAPWNWLVPILAAALASLVTAVLIDKPVTLSSSVPNHVGYFGIHAAALVLSLWLLQRTAFWQRRTGRSRALQFSIAHMLGLMTVVAVLATAMRSSPFFREEVGMNILFVISCVALAVVSVSLWTSSWHWLFRFTAVLGFAGLLGALFLIGAAALSTLDYAEIMSVVMSSHYLIQGIVLSVWLAWGQILPIPRTSGAGPGGA